MIIEKAEYANYKLKRINNLNSGTCTVDKSLLFNNGFDDNHFIQLTDRILSLKLNSANIRNMSREDILTHFKLFEEAMWYYNDHLKIIRYKIMNLYVLLYILFSNLTDSDLKYLTNMYNNIVQELPLSGAVLVNQDKNSVLLVKNNFSRTWSYPKGKINRFESSSEAAIRECIEETGYDITDKLNEDDRIVRKFNRRYVYLYVITDVPQDYQFKAYNKNEISEIRWFPIDNNLRNCREFNIYINKSYPDLKRMLNT